MSKAIQDWAYNAWETFHGRKPSWSKAEWDNLARAIRRLPEPDFRSAWAAYLRCEDRFFKGKPPRLFNQNLDRFLEDGRLLRATDRQEDPSISARMARQVRRAHEIRRDSPEKDWRTCVSEAAKEMGLR